MRIPSCTRGFTLATVASRKWFLLVAVIASLAVVPASAGAAKSTKHRLKAFASCSRFVHYARDHAPRGIATRGIPVDVPMPTTRAPQPMDQQGVAQPESAPTAGGGAGQDFSTTNVQEQGV